jgi:hypothetical protein
MSSELQFTRYLYVKEEVKLSLILCILNKKDEAIFWAYELYYSEFKSELINLFWCMYYDFYYTLNPSFEKYLQQKLKTNLVFEINCDNCDNWLAMIVNNFMIRPHTMDIFMLKQIIQICDFDNPCIQEYKSSSNFTIINNELESILETQDFMILASLILTEIKDEHITEALKTVINYFNKKGLKLDSTKIINEYLKNLRNDYQLNNKRLIILSKILHYFMLIKKIKLGKNIYVHIEPEEVIIYETINADLKAKDNELGGSILPAYKILPLATIYYIDKYNYLSLFHLKREKIDIKVMYREHWLYYASFSPLWKERILKHNGFINEINKKVMFLEKENSDDNEQAFYNEFGYEPDEQKIEIQNKTIQDIKSERTWASFYNEHKNSGIITIDDDILNDLSKVIYFVNM